MKTLRPDDLTIQTLGPCKIPSPLDFSNIPGDGRGDFVPDSSRVRYVVEIPPTDYVAGLDPGDELLFERAGPREKIFFDPRVTTAAVVTCGGLCPGINSVIRSLYLELRFRYGVPKIYGIRYGFQGLSANTQTPPIELTLDLVQRIHLQGGTVLGSSRGPVSSAEAADTLQRLGIQMLFCVGGDGTQRGAQALAEELRARHRSIAVIGIPKTIDNDIPMIDRTFGFVTALEQARRVIECAHVEATGAPNGITLVKSMGRQAGFIAAGATLASQDVNFALIPEVPFPLEGPQGLLPALERRLSDRGHAVIVVAEGAGQELLSECPTEYDASGNPKLGDIATLLRQKITAYFNERKIPISLKYIDPSYIIRSVAPNCDDSLLCDAMARHAVHAAMAGKTDLIVGIWHGSLIYIPIAVATAEKKRLSPESELWRGVLATTGQPNWDGRP